MFDLCADDKFENDQRWYFQQKLTVGIRNLTKSISSVPLVGYSAVMAVVRSPRKLVKQITWFNATNVSLNNFPSDYALKAFLRIFLVYIVKYILSGILKTGAWIWNYKPYFTVGFHQLTHVLLTTAAISLICS